MRNSYHYQCCKVRHSSQFVMFRNRGVIFLLLIAISGRVVFSANILYIAAIASPSHHIWNRALAFGLANKGHNVTYIGPDKDNVPKPQNYTQILLDGVYEELNNNFDYNEMGLSSPITILNEIQSWFIFNCKLNLKANGFRTLLNYPSDFFDLIVFDITTGSCLYPLIHRFNYPPTVGVTPFHLPTYISFNFGNNLFPSYIPFYVYPYTTQMNFFQRTSNFLLTYADIILRHMYQYPEERRIATKVFGEEIPTMEELERHISLILANTDPLLGFPQPVPPNIIPVGGLHTKRAKEIPQDLQNILDNAKDGVILFSLGTNIRSDRLSRTTQEAILKAFSKLKETVIWKFESKIDNVPKNVIVRKWLPQNDIFAHKNVKVFIGHGGGLSTQESIFHGVPIICIPFLADQLSNTRIVVEKQIGVEVDFRIITTEYFLNKIREILDNPMYDKNMKELSRRFRDRPETPMERAIFWIEYVLRHGTADFLNTPARDLPFYKSSSLDVVTFLIFFISVIVYVLYKTVLIILKPFQGKKKVKTH